MKQPTREQVDFYRENGFVVFDEFLDGEELAEWRGAVEEATSERKTALPDRDLHDLEGVSDERRAHIDYYLGTFTQRINLWTTNERVRKIILDPRLGEVAGRLAGVDGVRVWHDQALIKQPYANPTGFHLDVPYWSFSSSDAISMWVALDDATVYNGCLCYIPGSHKTHRYDDVAIGPEIGALFEVYPEWKDVHPVFCPVKAGGAVYHNGLTAHGAGANMTPGLRRAFTCGYMPDGSTFNGQPNILPAEYMAQLKVGDVLENDELNPLLWSRRKAS